MKIQKKQEIEFFGTKTGNANSIALGYATETKNFGEVAVGVMNKSTAAKDPNSSKGVCVDPDATLFSVGCGGSGERKNALEVKGDGSVIIPGENGNINIADKIKQAFDTDASIELVKSAENSLQYTLMVNNEARGSINIPIGDLKDIYTAGEGINIDNNVISADFSSVMTAISDEKTQRETTDNEIKSTLDTKADKSEIMIVNRTNDGEYATIQTFDQTSVGFGIDSDGQTDPGIHVSGEYGNVHIHETGVTIHSDDCDSGSDGFFVYYNLGSRIICGMLTPYGVICSALPQKDTNVLTTNGKSVDLTEYALKSTLDAKADVSAIPTKVSQLTNDRGYLTHHQSLSEYAKKANVWETDSRGDIVFNVTETDEDSGTYTGKYTFSKDGGFSVQSRWSLDDTTTDYSFDRYGFFANWICGNEIEYSNRKYTTINCDRGIINLKNFIINVDDAESSSARGVILPIKTFGGATYYPEIPYATQSSNGIMSSADKVKLDGMQALIDAKANKDDVLKINHITDNVDTVTFGQFSISHVKSLSQSRLMISDQSIGYEEFEKINALPSITGELSNITAATTTEDMITKFNDLLADLKAKGYMTADVTA